MEQTFDKEQWAMQKQEERELAYSTIDNMADMVLGDNETLQSYLKMQGTLGKTGVSNTLLVLAQNPDATRIASYDDWAEKGRSVTKGAKAINILEAHREYTKVDGTLGINFKVKKVFDIAQTNGKQLRDYRYPSNTQQHISTEWSASDFRNKDDFETACVAAIVGERYGVAPKIVLPEIPTDIKDLDTRDKKELLQDIRETAVDIIERVDKALFEERQQNKSQPER